MTTATLNKLNLTPKQEAFALYLFQGLSQRDAYLKAGYSSNQLPDTIDRAASALANSHKVFTRLQTLKDARETKAVADVQERKEVLTEVVRARVGLFTDENGNLSVKREQLNNAAVQEINTERTPIGIRTRLKLRDPIAAIEVLNKMERIGAQDSTIINFNEIKILVVREEPKQVTE